MPVGDVCIIWYFAAAGPTDQRMETPAAVVVLEVQIWIQLTFSVDVVRPQSCEFSASCPPVGSRIVFLRQVFH